MLIKKILIIGIIFLFLGLCINQSVATITPIKPIQLNNTLYVGGSGEGNYSTIQDAINDASDGDTVFVYDDSSPYYENLVIGKSINLIGENRDTTYVRGRWYADAVINITSDWVNISGFSIYEGDNIGLKICSDYNTITSNNIFEQLYTGIEICSNFNVIKDNNISEYWDCGIYLSNYAFGNYIHGNNIAGDYSHYYNFGISLSDNCNNNTITGNTIYDNLYGISLSNFNTGNIISNNNFPNNEQSIFLDLSNNNKITDNNFSENHYMLNLKESNNNTISGNTFNGGCCGSISLYESNNNTITWNTFNTSPASGVSLRNSNKNLITWNIFLKRGLYIINSDLNTIVSNSFFNCGLRYGGNSYNNNISKNMINEKKLIFLENESDIVLNGDAGQIVLVNCENITIKNQNLSNTSYGIELWRTQNSSIFNNLLSSNIYGIFLYNNSNNNNIYSNIIFDNGWGVYLQSSSYNKIKINSIISNRNNGIKLLTSSKYNTFEGNNIRKNEYGIYLSDECLPNKFFHNNLIENVINVEAYSYVTWDDGYPSGGNYWDDYIGEDNYSGYNQDIPGSDGIGDTPYNIPDKSKDRYPLMQPWPNSPPNAPFIDGPKRGKIRVEYEYKFSLSDPDDDKVHLRIDWGNGIPSKWYGPYKSASTVKLNHSWNEKGKYTIRAQTQDSNGHYSNWSYLEVNIPRTRASSNHWFELLFERFQNTFPTLRQLLGLI